VNLYAYVGNNPVGFVDRMGLAAKEFVKAYDDYLEKKLIFKSINQKITEAYKYPMITGKNNLIQRLQETRKIAYDELLPAEKIAKQLHYDRNRYNINLPTSIDHAKDELWEEPKFRWSAYLWAFFHQDYNVWWIERKFVSPNWHREIIFYKNSEKLTNDKYIWTYNFYSPILNPGLHKDYDVDTYLEWWNTLNNN